MEVVRHGKWLVRIFDNVELYDGCHGTPFCSECIQNALLNGAEEYVDSNYCPNCGAKMDLNIEEE